MQKFLIGKNTYRRWMRMTDKYIWVKYADDENGSNMSDNSSRKKFIGVATNKKTANDSDDPNDYTWESIS